jgi:prepilin-type processing-associated H-X9-DG protein
MALYTVAGAEAQPRFYIDLGGFHRWGPGGSTAPDTDLYRASPGLLTTNGAFQTQGYVAVLQYVQAGMSYSAGGYAFAANASGDTQLRFLLQNTGAMSWGPGNAASDTALYRSGAGALKTDGNLSVVGQLYANQGLATQVSLTPVGGLAGMYFGSGFDTTLYRAATNTLKTDGALQVVGAVAMGWTGSQWALQVNTAGNIVFADGSVQSTAAAPAPKIVRGNVTGAGGITNGSGFTVSRTGAGQYTVTFSPAFSTTPVVICAPIRNGMLFMHVSGLPSTTTFSVIVRGTGGAVEDADWSFIAIAS